MNEQRDPASEGQDAGSPAEASDAGRSTPDAGGPHPDPLPVGEGGGCTRERLTALVDDYFRALAAHDASSLRVAADAKFTENGMVLPLGQGMLWTSAGALTFKRSLLDTERCGTLTHGVIDRAGTPTIVGVRLKLQADAITEVESYIVTGGFFNNPSGVSNDGNAAWEDVLPADQRSTRDTLNAIADSYFELFNGAPATSVPFATECMRYENGQVAPGVMHCSDGVPSGLRVTDRRYPIADLEAGIAVGFVLFAGSLDFHMFKVRAGQVVGIHALVASRASASGWD